MRALPGGCTRISMPQLRMSSGSSSSRVALPPPNSSVKVCWNASLMTENCRAKMVFHLLGDVGDDALQLLLGLEHVVPLVGQVGVPLVDPLELLNGIQVDVAQTGDRLFQLAHPALGLGDALQLHPLGAGGLMGQLIGLPQLVQQGFLLQGGGGLPLF